MKLQLAAVTLCKNKTFVAGTSEETKKPVFYHADQWKLEGNVLTRLHKRPRKTMFVPLGTRDLPVDAEELADFRRTEVTFADGKTQVFEDSWRTSEDPTKILDPSMTWTGKTVLQTKT